MRIKVESVLKFVEMTLLECCVQSEIFDMFLLQKCHFNKNEMSFGFGGITLN